MSDLMLFVDKFEDELLSPEIPTLGQKLSSEECMSLACQLAFIGAGFVRSNPMVGAVLVDKNHCFLEWGAHELFGGAHAERAIFNKMKSNKRLKQFEGSVLYCTLEPCSFKGKTPSCAHLLRDLPLKKIVYGQKDPNKLVNGEGLRLLRDAGIECVQNNVFKSISKKLIEVFSWNQKMQLPFVALKAATTLDQKYAQNKGDRKLWITSERAREYGHWLRQLYDAVLVGADTVILDNPKLNVRHPNITKTSEPIIIVLDPHYKAMKFALSNRLELLHEGHSRVVWVTGPECNLPAKNADEFVKKYSIKILKVPFLSSHQLNLKLLLQSLWENDVCSILLEGGGYVWSSFGELDLVNKLHLFIAPKIWTKSECLFSLPLPQASQLERVTYRNCGGDLLVEGIIHS